VTVDGAVHNSYNFKIPNTGISRSDLISLAHPFPNSFYATISGARNALPFTSYIKLSELKEFTFLDGDQITFEVEQFNDSMSIRVEGGHIGQSRFSVYRNASLKDVLNYIEIDPKLSDISSISLRRKSIQRRQVQALQESLIRLKSAVLSKKPLTSAGAALAVQEAQLIANFVERAKKFSQEVY